MATRGVERRLRGGGPASRKIGVVRLPEDAYCRLVSLSVAADKPLVALIRRAVIEALPRWEALMKDDRMALL